MIKDQSSSTSSPASGSRWVMPAVVFLLLATITLAAWRWQVTTQAGVLHDIGLHDSAAHTAEVRDRLKVNAQFLGSLQAFATTNASEDIDAWRRYVKEIDIARNLGGLYAFAYAPAVRPGQHVAFVAAWRNKVKRDDFAITPPPGNTLATPVVFFAPETPELQAVLGFNLLSEAARRESIEAAIATREIAMTGRVTLIVDEKTRRPGFLLLKALFRPGMPVNSVEERQAAFAGLVFAAYHTDDFLASLNLGLSSQVAVQIFDDGSSNRPALAMLPSLIFDSNPEFQTAASDQVFHHEIDFGGRAWVLHYRARSSQGTGGGIDPAQLILVGGLFVSALLTLLVFHLTNHRERAERYAHQITAELSRSEERMRLATTGANDGLWDQDLRTGEEYISDRMVEIFGFPLAEAPQRMSFYVERIHPEDRERHHAALRRHFRNQHPFDLELRIGKANGDDAWIRVRGEAVRNVTGKPIRLAGVITDITDKKQTEARLERLGHLLKTSISAMPLPVFVHDEKRKLQMVNIALCELLGTTEHQLLAGFWPDFEGIATTDRRRLIGASERMLSIGHSEPVEFEFQGKDQVTHILVARTAKAQNQEGDPFLITTLTDVTELRRAAASIKAADRMKQAVLDAATEVAIVATDPNGLVTIFNRGAERMLGYEAAEIVNLQTPLLFHVPAEIDKRASELESELGQKPDSFDTFVALARKGTPEQREWTYVRKDGSLLTVKLVATSQRDANGRISGYLGIAVDISDQKKAESELKRHRDHLQEMVSERTARLDIALQEAQTANLTKSEFLANMSHELRTPMHAILSFAELGEDRAEAGNQLKIAQYFARIGQSAKRLLGLINDLLDLAKLEAGHLELKLAPIEILNLLRHTSSQLESLLLAHQLAVDVSYSTLDTNLVGDPKRIAQVLHNLLSNAIKFSPDGSTIKIHLGPAELPAVGDGNLPQAALAISFSDSGIGIPADELHSIFEKFVQSSATKNGAGGTGLGLAICREIVHQHRGTIVAENNAGGGACFTVTLPLNIRTGQTGQYD